MAEKIEVSRSEYYRELGLLSVKHRRYRTLRSRYYTIMGHLSGLARERATLIRRIPYVGIIERVRIGRRIDEIDREYALFLEEMRRIRTVEIASVLADIEEERKRLARKVIPPPPPPPPPPLPPEQLIGDEAITGYDIYYNTETRKYIIRDPNEITFRVGYPKFVGADGKRYGPFEEGEKAKIPEDILEEDAYRFVSEGIAEFTLIREEDKLVIEWTGSLETGVGNDVPLTVEITAVVAVKEFDADDIIHLVKEDGDYDESLYIKVGTVWGTDLLAALRKIGISYNGYSIAERWYPFPIHDYPIAHVFFERKSRYIRLRGYHNDVNLTTHEHQTCPQYPGGRE